jgi:hypothetical protein
VAHVWNLHYFGGLGKEDLGPRLAQSKSLDPIWKITKAKRAGSVVQGVEHLTSKHNIQVQTPVPQKKKKPYKEKYLTIK